MPSAWGDSTPVDGAAADSDKEQSVEDAADAADRDEQPRSQALFEWRTYVLRDAAKRDFVSAYLQNAALPAWQRLGAGPIGVFSEVGEEPAPHLHVLLSYADAAVFTAVRTGVRDDAKYRAAAADYLAAGKDDPAFVRIASELLLAFAAAPQATPPQKQPRLYELRTYESHSESKARRKIEMFNDGEIGIFAKCGFEPVFFGETLVGPRLPNLKYMLASTDLEANQASWKRFTEHPEWLQIRDLPKYADTVSHIDKKFLAPTAYSQL